MINLHIFIQINIIIKSNINHNSSLDTEFSFQCFIFTMYQEIYILLKIKKFLKQ